MQVILSLVMSQKSVVLLYRFLCSKARNYYVKRTYKIVYLMSQRYKCN